MSVLAKGWQKAHLNLVLWERGLEVVERQECVVEIQCAEWAGQPGRMKVGGGRVLATCKINFV